MKQEDRIGRGMAYNSLSGAWAWMATAKSQHYLHFHPKKNEFLLCLRDLPLANHAEVVINNPAMNITKLLTVASLAFSIFAAPVFAESCCDKAKAAGKDCAHPCCVEAKGKGEVCKKCNK
jgi:hypothetical protein